jgi:nucleoid-associated protein YgaU
MFGTRAFLTLMAVVVLVAAALSGARASSGAGREVRHRVRAGETLWAIAEAHYSGDPREAIWRIEQRNGLEGAEIRAGTVLWLPP